MPALKQCDPKIKEHAYFVFWLAKQKIMNFWINNDFQLFCSFEFNQKQKEQKMGAVLDAQR